MVFLFSDSLFFFMFFLPCATRHCAIEQTSIGSLICIYRKDGPKPQ